MINRRSLLLNAAVVATPFIASATPAVAQDSVGMPPETISDIPVNGVPVPSLRRFDEWVISVMRQRRCPGAAFAFVQGGRLLYARGFGYADPTARDPFTPTTLCRIGSTSKPITATAVLTLIRDGKLRLEDRAFPLLGLRPFLKPGASADPRLWGITVRQLLQHTGGFEGKKHGEYWWAQQWNADAMGLPLPLSSEAVVRYGMGLPLANDPGSTYTYSNYGYLVLGRLIEKVSGQSYEQYVRDRVLRPLGISGMFTAKTRLTDRRPGEARYHDLVGGNYQEELSVLPETRGKRLPLSYGGAFYWESADASGGWLASAVDLARFVSGITVPGPRALLDRMLTRQITARPPAPVSRDADGNPASTYYGLGWFFDARAADRELLFYHSGAVCGAGSVIQNRFNGVTLVGVFNANIPGYELPAKFLESYHPMADQFDAERAWPPHDLFPRFH